MEQLLLMAIAQDLDMKLDQADGYLCTLVYCRLNQVT